MWYLIVSFPDLCTLTYFNILCFMESQLDANMTTKSMIMSIKYDIPYRKDGAIHCGGLLMYLSCGFAHVRIIDLETFWNELIWVEIKLNRESYLVGLFYSTRPADTFYDALNKKNRKGSRHYQ